MARFAVGLVFTCVVLGSSIAHATDLAVVNPNFTVAPQPRPDLEGFPPFSNPDEANREKLNTPLGQVVDCVCDVDWAVGDRVKAIVNNPGGANGINSGHYGLIISGFSVTGAVLVAWDGWIQGHNGNNASECPPYTAQNATAWWVQCSDIAPAALEVLSICGQAYAVGTRIQAFVDSPSSAAGVVAGDQGTVMCTGLAGGPLISWDRWSNGHDGNGYCADPPAAPPVEMDSGWFVDCGEIGFGTEVYCRCYGVFDHGDRVQAAVDNPAGAVGIVAGDTGTVICARYPASPPLLIRWDNWTLGHGGSGCLCPDLGGGGLADPSGWFVDCDEVRKEYDAIFIDGFEGGNTSHWSSRFDPGVIFR